MMRGLRTGSSGYLNLVPSAFCNIEVRRILVIHNEFTR